MKPELTEALRRIENAIVTERITYGADHEDLVALAIITEALGELDKRREFAPLENVELDERRVATAPVAYLQTVDDVPSYLDALVEPVAEPREIRVGSTWRRKASGVEHHIIEPHTDPDRVASFRERYEWVSDPTVDAKETT